MENECEISGAEAELEKALEECDSCTEFAPGNVIHILDKNRLKKCLDNLCRFSRSKKAQEAIQIYKELLKNVDTGNQVSYFGMLVHVKLTAPTAVSTMSNALEISDATHVEMEVILSEHIEKQKGETPPVTPKKSPSPKPFAQKIQTNPMHYSLFNTLIMIEGHEQKIHTEAQKKLRKLCDAIEKGDQDSVMLRFIASKSKIETIRSEYDLKPRLIPTLENIIRIRSGQ